MEIWNGKVYDINDEYLFDVKNGQPIVAINYDINKLTAEYSYGRWNAKGKEYNGNN